jgi:phosphoadenosine phosphosulfate reductase
MTPESSWASNNNGGIDMFKKVGEFFSKERATRNEKLMKPEVRELLDLSLEEKIKKSQEIIKEATDKFPRLGLGFSGGTDSLILLHMALPICPNVEVLFVNTRHQFPETYDFIKKVRKDWDIKNFHEAMAEKDRFEEFSKKFGLKTPEFTTACCEYHKINPKNKAIEDLGLDGFLSGIRGVEHEERAIETIFSPRDTHIRVHPLLFWRRNDVIEYVKRNGIECNPVYAKGYTSLGCVECTERNIDPNAHERAGRGVAREKIMGRLRELGYD